jgi:cell division protein FtsQ
VTARKRASRSRAAQRQQAATRRPARAVAAPAPRAIRTKKSSAIRVNKTSGAYRFLPSGRSILTGLALIALAGGAYAVARQTSMFSVARIEVSGGTPELRAQVRHELATLRGTSLLALDGSALERRVESLPTIMSARYDRAFPHTLRLTVVPEVPVAVLHRGSETWLLSGRGRAVKRIQPRTRPFLPRIWIPRATTVEVGGFVQPEGAGRAARSLALGSHFPGRISTAAIVHGELVLRLRSGIELRLGQPADVRLKLAIARRALRDLPAGSVYLDVSVPGRPVAGPQPSTLR